MKNTESLDAKIYPQPEAKTWKRLVPSRVRMAYRTARLGIRLLRDLDLGSPRVIRDSLVLSEAIFKVTPYTLLRVNDLKSLHWSARELDRNGIAGDFVECGVYRGGSAALLGATMRRSPFPRHLWLFDSFQGLPRPTEADGPSAVPFNGELVSEEQNVRRLLSKVGVPSNRVHIVPGWFHETLPRSQVTRVALLHIDADWYESIKLCLEHFYDVLSPGAVVVLDDYDCWPGCKAALDEFAAARAVKITLTRQ